MSNPTKPNLMTGDARIAKKTDVVKRERTNVVESANRWLGIVTLLIKFVTLLQSLPWEKLHHLT
jgi:hypothetical protein